MPDLTEIESQIIDRLFEEMRARGRKQTDIGRAIGVDSGNLSKFKTKQRMPSAEVILLMAREIGVDVGFILTGRQPEPAPASAPAPSSTPEGKLHLVSEMEGVLLKLGRKMGVKHAVDLLIELSNPGGVDAAPIEPGERPAADRRASGR